ncbi:sulfatase-like hydrolase/transferase [Bacteroidota bacterium]
MKKALMIYLIIFMGVWSLTKSQAYKSQGKPNVIVILTDDQGYADVGYQGFPASEEVITPRLDELAKTGKIFQNGYVASATCGPSRASLLTGRSSSRFSVEDNGNLPGGDTGPPQNEIIVPAIISEYGYVSAAFGKWHLGEREGMTPEDRGFDYYWGGRGGSGDYFFRRNPPPPCWDSEKSSDEAYMTDATTDEAIAFIERNLDKPFFAYIAYNAPHSPFETKRFLVERVVEQRPQFADAYERMKKETDKWNGENYDFGRFKGLDLDMEILRLVYISMLMRVDDGVGEIVQTLEKYDIRDNTLIFYLSDNGAALSRPNDLGGVNLPLRSGKGSVYDGGVRVPFVMNWPGVIKPSWNADLVVSSMDIFTTTIELAGGQIPRDRIIDGVNLIPYVTGEKKGQPHEYLFFRRKVRNFWSIRKGDMKWVYNEKDKSAEPEGGGLYNIQLNVSEYIDLSGKFPEMKEELKELFYKVTKDFPEPMQQHN